MNALQWLRAGSLAWGLVAVCDVAAEPTNDPAQAAAQAAAARFRALDVNHDGLLSRYEYDAEVVFETADTDHDGLLTAQELEAVLPAAAPGTPSVARRMLVADLDRDGKLNEDELQRALESRFDWLDLDHDGNLDLAEMSAGYGVRVRP